MNSGDFNARLTLSVHYASNPTLDNNSIEDRSVGSNSGSSSSGCGSAISPGGRNDEDFFELSSTSGSSSSTRRRGSSSTGSRRRTSTRDDFAVEDICSTRVDRQQQQQVPYATATLVRKPRLIHRPKSLYHLNQPDCIAPVAVTATNVTAGQQQQSSIDSLAVTDADLRAIDTSYRGHKTRVFVCTALANLYTSTPSSSPWQLVYTGIPVLVLDTGASRARTRRQIQLILVEKGTCFALWRDVVDNLSQYSREDEMFHTLRLSTDHGCKVGLSFDSAEAAAKFHACLEMLTADPANIALRGPGEVISRKLQKKQQQQQQLERSRQQQQQSKYRRPSKAEISLPCGFQHVVSVGHSDTSKYFSLQAFVVDNNTETSEEISFIGMFSLLARNGSSSSRSWKKASTTSLASTMQRTTKAELVDNKSLSLSNQMARLSVFNSCNELSC